jgi:hypothetical protein
MVGRIAGALPAWDVFRFGDLVKAGEIIWVRLIDGHEGLFWFLQNIHDGFLLDFALRGERLGPHCRALTYVLKRPDILTAFWTLSDAFLAESLNSGSSSIRSSAPRPPYLSFLMSSLIRLCITRCSLLKAVARYAPDYFGNKFTRGWYMENKNWIYPEFVRVIDEKLLSTPLGSDIEYYERIDNHFID